MNSNPASASRGFAVLGAAVAVALVAVIALVASGAFGRSADPSPAPSVPPISSPNPDPSADPSPQPSPSPADPALAPVDLVTGSGNDVIIDVEDLTGHLGGVSAGEAGGGMSVRWFDDIVTALDSRTVQVTWVGLPVDEEVTLLVSEYEGGYRLHFAQQNPPLYSDAVGADRVLELTFDQPVDPESVVVTFQGGPDNEG